MLGKLWNMGHRYIDKETVNVLPHDGHFMEINANLYQHKLFDTHKRMMQIMHAIRLVKRVFKRESIYLIKV